MKFLTCATALALAVTGTIQSYAADLSLSSPALQQYPAPPTDLWSGAFAGLTASGLVTDFDKNCLPGQEMYCAFDKNSSGTGVGVGAQIGYNFNFDPVVIGAVLSASLLPSNSTNIDYLASGRLRVGVTPVANGLLYAAGGIAVAGIQDSVSTIPTPTMYTGANPAYGVVIGAGYEHMVSENVSLGAEANYYRFEDAIQISTMGAPGTPSTPIGNRNGTFMEAKFGVNFHF